MIDLKRLMESLAVVFILFMAAAVTITIILITIKEFGIIGYFIFLSFIFAVISTYIYKGIND